MFCCFFSFEEWGIVTYLENLNVIVLTDSRSVVRADLSMANSAGEGAHHVGVSVYRHCAVAARLVVRTYRGQDYEQQRRVWRHDTERWLKIERTQTIRLALSV